MKFTMMDRCIKAAGRGRVLLAVGLFVLAGIGAVQAQTVIVQGNRRVDADTIRSYVTGRAAGSLDDVRRELVATGLFSDVRVSRGGNGAIVVAVQENEVVNRVVLEGNKKLNKDVLLGELQTKARGAFSPTAAQADVARILDIYKRSGRGFATVTYRTVPLPNGRVDVVFTIVEGDKTGIQEINFVGNNVYSGRKLRDLMNSTETNFLSFLKTSDVYDPDKIASDEELIRRFYLKNGYADFRIVATDATFDAARGGWVVTITLEEGEQYRVAAVRVDSRLPDVDPAVLERQVRSTPGEVYNAESVEKTLNGITTEVARRGYAFAQVRPSGARDSLTHTIGLTYVVEEGPRVYIERIVIRGNIRTRDYVLRREFDIGEGDAYNKVLMDRAERRLNSLGYFKKVRITTEPGSTPDRVIVNVDVEDQPTGQFSVSGGYSTQDGFIAEVAVAETNFLGRGQYARLSGTIGQRTNGVEFSFTEPYFLGQRLAAGFDIFTKYNDNTQFARYTTRTTGATVRVGLPITEEFSVLLRYSLYATTLKVPNSFRQPFDDCTRPLPGVTVLTDGTLADGTKPLPARFPDCAFNGEASIAIKEAQGDTITSVAGVTLAYNTLDNTKDPRNGFYAELRPDIAGLGGDSRFARVTTDVRYYHEFWEDIVGIARLQAGTVQPLDGDLRIIDHFFLGPTLVRGFAPSGIGPRDLNGDPRANAIGGTTYFGGSLEAQFPLFGLPRDLGLRGAVFADAGTLFGYQGRRFFTDVVFTDAGQPVTNLCNRADIQAACVDVRDDRAIRSSVGASLLWQSPLGPIRFDYAIALSKARGDQTQAFRFSGGNRF